MKNVVTKIKFFINNNGKFKIIHQDNGREFDNKEMRIFCENEDIHYIESSTYHPQTSGVVEIIHKIKKKYLEKIFYFIINSNN